MTDSVVAEGHVKFRDGKKRGGAGIFLKFTFYILNFIWPPLCLDCLVLLVYKDKSDKALGHRERVSLILEDICGLDTGFSYEGVGYTLFILCLSQAAVLGFDGKEALLAWDIRIRYSLGEVHRFSVGILPGTKLGSGHAALHLCNNLLVLARDIPPVIIGQWNLPDLRRYGPVPNGFVFEGGTRCGYWAGVFFLSSLEGEQISFLFDCIVRGISPTRGPVGLRPVLPVLDPVASQAYAEERMNHEAQELEKRLSMLSHQSSSASSFSYVPSVAGDDRSVSGSSDTSDTSQSDSSIGSRLAIWSEPVTTNPAPTDIVTGQSGPKVTLQAEEKLSTSQVGGARTLAPPPQSRQLQEIGRQSSSDSGIATGSHSSYSGSFSSYTGSLDIAPGGDDFGSVLSFPPHLALDLAPCSCPPAPGHEYQVPTSLRYLYDIPRTVLQGETVRARGQVTSVKPKDSSHQSSPSCEPTQGEEEAHSGGCSDTVRCSTIKLLQGHPDSKSSVAPPSDSHHPDSSTVCSTAQTTASRSLLIICNTCGGFKGNPLSYSGVSAIPAIPGKHIDGCPVSPSSSSFEYVPVDSLASLTNHNTEKLSGIHEQPVDPRKKDKGKLAHLLADLLGRPGPAGEPGNKGSRLNRYESMTVALGRELRSPHPVSTTGPMVQLTSQKDKTSVIYENCSKCRKGVVCPPPARVTPSLPNRVCFGQPPPCEPSPEIGVDHQGMTEEGQLVEGQLPKPERQDGERPCVDVKGHLVSAEDKKQRSKEERRAVEYEVMEGRALEKSSEAEERSKYELMGRCGTQWFLHEAGGTMHVTPSDSTAPERPRGDGVTYVNIPVNPTPKKQLNYMEVDHQEPAGFRVTDHHLPGQRKSATKYAQIDIRATDAAHKTGTQHALGREEGLHTLELRRKGAPQ
ncbi:hypothetical protein DPEC_G00102310 [Dallia pectoralis]|uniref:Uncharacterized protein n=1 Tax=Dallia pectoralis TaxID=75939 RepID=A0ACC2GWX3_DALPE|nr:hypothetical protein DPEC_G00102310 [Dallia pectoralis]